MARRRTLLALAVTASLAVVSLLAGQAVIPAPAAAASTSLAYTVVDADDGVFYRTEPRWDTPNNQPGIGIYTGDRVELICGQWGGPAGPYGNTWWHYVRNLTRPEAGSGWANDHNLDTPGVAGERTLGEADCSGSEIAQESPRSIFYSPLESPTGLDGLTVADRNLSLDEWASGNCSPDKAVKIPDSVATLAGWSVGRLGPIYFLQGASEAQLRRIKTIILLDPGNTGSFVPYRVAGIPVLRRDRCDWKIDINGYLASWLKREGNRLIILTGRTTEEKEDDSNPNSRSTFAGLWHYYLAGIWNQEFAERAMVCDYNYMSHEDIMRQFAGAVNSPPASCPVAQNGQHPTQWHP